MKSYYKSYQKEEFSSTPTLASFEGSGALRLNPKNLIFGVLLVFQVGKTIKIQKTAKKNIDGPQLYENKKK